MQISRRHLIHVRVFQPYSQSLFAWLRKNLQIHCCINWVHMYCMVCFHYPPALQIGLFMHIYTSLHYSGIEPFFLQTKFFKTLFIQIYSLYFYLQLSSCSLSLLSFFWFIASSLWCRILSRMLLGRRLWELRTKHTVTQRKMLWWVLYDINTVVLNNWQLG